MKKGIESEVLEDTGNNAAAKRVVTLSTVPRVVGYTIGIAAVGCGLVARFNLRSQPPAA